FQPFLFINPQQFNSPHHTAHKSQALFICSHLSTFILCTVLHLPVEYSASLLGQFDRHPSAGSTKCTPDPRDGRQVALRRRDQRGGELPLCLPRAVTPVTKAALQHVATLHAHPIHEDAQRLAPAVIRDGRQLPAAPLLHQHGQAGTAAADPFDHVGVAGG
uniref:Uncharacterized protein n=1 Tax=Triticum urartu TaxID=4572 RepID=A0A8R7UW89_TRIUA